MSSDALRDLASTWRAEAMTFRLYREERLAVACERHADQVEEAAAAELLEAVTLEAAAELGGYSYSHLQHLVASGEIDNVGEKHAPRIRRSEIPRKPGHGASRQNSKAQALDRSLALHRARGE